MVSRQNARKIKNRKSQAIFSFRNARHASAAWKQKVRTIRRAYYRADRQLTRQDLRLAARGNPHLEELEAIEAEREKQWLEEIHYFESVERDWVRFRDEEDERLWDEDREDDWQAQAILYEDYLAEKEDARGLKYSYVDTDDNLMR